ncbi:uncharacterized protein LOC132303028 isoform X2 [Cornus florida]|uniref:uncharacterized protein LOC132303028 isoform X2 n=1 Tax=Cornus florida TaxID=4283 RepID=UPI0028988200|nr:uncharacterized protein LOC132303028 isoform X2 [Cornus florida]
MASHSTSLSLFLVFNLASLLVSADLVFEEGYSVTTVLDGNKLRINPHSVLPRPGSSDLIVLDSSGSAFYTVSFPSSQESVIKRIAGNGKGVLDGDTGSARFNKPKSFAVDLKGNVYVAEKNNHTVRKISNSGMGGAWLAWTLCLGASCLLGLVIGFAIRPYVIPHEGSSAVSLSKTWRHCLIGLEREILMFCFGIRSVVVSSKLYNLLRRLIMLSLSHLYLMFRINVVEPQTPREETVSLLDTDQLSCSEIPKLQNFPDQLKDLMCLDGGLELSDITKKTFEQGDADEDRTDVLSDSRGRIDNMIQANITCFAGQSKKTTPVEEYLVSSSGLVKRR